MRKSCISPVEVVESVDQELLYRIEKLHDSMARAITSTRSELT